MRWNLGAHLSLLTLYINLNWRPGDPSLYKQKAYPLPYGHLGLTTNYSPDQSVTPSSKLQLEKWMTVITATHHPILKSSPVLSAVVSHLKKSRKSCNFSRSSFPPQAQFFTAKFPTLRLTWKCPGDVVREKLPRRIGEWTLAPKQMRATVSVVFSFTRMFPLKVMYFFYVVFKPFCSGRPWIGVDGSA